VIDSAAQQARFSLACVTVRGSCAECLFNVFKDRLNFSQGSHDRRMTQQIKRFCDFGPFRLDRQKRLLSQGSETLPLPPKTIEVLLFLIDNRGRVIEKSEFMKAVWPDSFVEEGNLSQNIFLLRKTLGDGQDGQRYILTVPGVGYRFVPEVAEHEAQAPTELPAEVGPFKAVQGSALPRRRSPTLRIVVYVTALVLALAVGFVLHPPHKSEPPQALRETQLTTNAAEASLTTAAISPDGNYLAFADEHGLYVRQTASGETHLLALPSGAKIYRLSWFPDGSNVLASGITSESPVPGVWSISLLGGNFRKLRDDVEEAVASPDGAKILFTTKLESEIWVMGSNGEEPGRILSGTAQEAFGGLAWFPDGKRILFLRFPLVGPNAVESLQLEGGQPAIVVSANGLVALVFLRDGRLLYGVGGESGNDSKVSLWEVQVDLRSGRAAGGTHAFMRWKNTRISDLSVTSDGKRLAFLKGNPQGDVYVGNLEQNGKVLTAPRRLTLDDLDDQPSDWTPDSRSVLFFSNRNGTYDIFRQSLDETTAQALVENKRVKTRPRMSPDGNWVLYYDPPGNSRIERLRISRVPLAGGPTETVLEEQGLYVVRCARPPASRCIAGVLHPQELVVYALDPIKGRGPELVRIPVNADVEEPNLDLSSDGKSVAFISLNMLAGKIRVISLLHGSQRDVDVKGWNSFNHVNWAADGKGWYVSSELALASTLLYVDLSGNPTILLREPGLFTEIWGIPSPDGKHLAFLRYNSGNNAWVLEGF
jgi:DNA-binding winged helix-turn-helix (wHTH) protein/Tol biopolymer transport system component